MNRNETRKPSEISVYNDKEILEGFLFIDF